MAYSEEILRRAKARLAQARQEQQEIYEAHLLEAYARYPRLQEIDRELRATMAQVVATAFRSGEDPEQAITELRDKNLALQQEREWILEASELDPDFLDDTPVCTKCGGTGYLGATMCDCLRELCRSEQKKELSSLIGSGKERFAAFRLDYYSDKPDPNWGVSPRALMTRTLEQCRRVTPETIRHERPLEQCRSYAANFSLQSPSLLFSGNPGLGKTFLSGCIARAVADRGFSVVYDTAIHIISDYEAVKFRETSEESRDALRRYTACDLLIIDDLGTELVTQFTLSVLYQVLNSRIIENLPTIVSTNLNSTGIRSRYTPQIASRLLGTFDLVRFLGDDIRLRGK